MFFNREGYEMLAFLFAGAKMQHAPLTILKLYTYRDAHIGDYCLDNYTAQGNSTSKLTYSNELPQQWCHQ